MKFNESLPGECSRFCDWSAVPCITLNVDKIMMNALEMVALQAIIETLHDWPTSDPFDKIPLRVNV